MIKKSAYRPSYWHTWTCLKTDVIVGFFFSYFNHFNFLVQEITMRIVFIFLSVGVLLTFIQFSNGARKTCVQFVMGFLWFFFLVARRVRTLDSDEVPNTMKKFAYKWEPYKNDDSSEESDESNEEEKKKVVDTNEYIEKFEESSNEQNKEEEEDRDNEAMLSRFIGINHEKLSENSDEN